MGCTVPKPVCYNGFLMTRGRQRISLASPQDRIRDFNVVWTTREGGTTFATFAELQKWKESNVATNLRQQLTLTAFCTLSEEGFRLFQMNVPFSQLDFEGYKLRKMVDLLCLFDPDIGDKPAQWVYPRLRHLLEQKDLSLLSEAVDGKNVLAMLRAATPKRAAAPLAITNRERRTAEICLKYRDRQDRQSNLEMVKELDGKVGSPLRSKYQTHISMAYNPGTARQFKKRWIERAKKWKLTPAE